MSSKTVKVTNGKIVNYTITATGYKTINGSQLIIADTTINKNMIAEVDPNGVYSLGDRIGGIASFVCYFNSTNPETNVDTKYAVFVLDAKYRTYYDTLGQLGHTGLPSYSDSTSALNAKESATYNTNYVINTGNFDYFISARNAATITIDGIVYNSQLPNIYEVKQIWDNKDVLDNKDITATDYSTTTLNYSVIERYISSTDYANVTSQYRWFVQKSDGNVLSYWSTGKALIIPVFEIPVE